MNALIATGAIAILLLLITLILGIVGFLLLTLGNVVLRLKDNS